MGFIARWANHNTALHLLGKPRSYNPDSFDNNLLWNFMRNDLDSEYWRQASARWDKIKVPVYSVGNWGGSSMHLRGNTEGYLCPASKHKKLRIHSGTHYHPFHSEEGRIDQLRWFDHWLKGIDTGIMDEPPVKLEIRTGGSLDKPYPFRFEDDWPIPRTQWTKYHLRIERAPSENPKAVEGTLTTTPAGQTGTASYGQGAPSRPGKIPRGISFETPPMEKDTEVTGPVVLNVWISSTGVDADIFATLRNIDPAGNDVCEMGQQGEPLQCVTKGWLRASHRKLDPEKSLPYRPYHAHDERWWLKPGEVVECQVEIWSTSMVFKKGHKLRLDISPADGVGTQHFTHFHADYNADAVTTIHAGGDKASYLLLPIIPPK
jgi:putative CocE/NonD family hydrolase